MNSENWWPKWEQMQLSKSSWARCFNLILIFKFWLYWVFWGFSQLSICRPFPLQFCPHYNGRCAMCWIEWKINFSIFIFLWAIVVFVHNFQVFLPWNIKFFTKKILHKKILQKLSNLHERCAMSWNEFKINFPMFSFWVMIYFVLKKQRKIDQFWVQKRPYLKN